MANEKSHSEQFEELCAGYVLHSLDAEERDQFEQMLGDATDEQQRLYQELWSAANQLAFSVQESEPSSALKERIMDTVRAEADGQGASITSIEEEEPATPDKKEDESSFNWPALAAAASFALLIVSLSLLFYSFNLSSEITDQETVIADQKTTITELETELQQKEEMLAILGSRDVDMVVMAGLEVNPNGYGKVLWDSEQQQALLQVSNLPAVPQDKDYQLWIIRNNKPVSAGVFAVHDTSNNFFKIEEMAKADEQSANAFAITMEPKGGVPQPTGDMYLLGDMKKNAGS